MPLACAAGRPSRGDGRGLGGECGPCAVARQALETLAVLFVDGDAGMQGEAIETGAPGRRRRRGQTGDGQGARGEELNLREHIVGLGLVEATATAQEVDDTL